MKKAIAFMIVVLMVMIIPCGAYAAEPIIDDNVRYDFIKDRVAQNGETFGQYKKIFESKDLDYEDIRTLQIMGFSFMDIVRMDRDKAHRLINGDVELRYTRPNNYVRVTNVGGAGSSAVEYFHPNTGMEAGDFYSSTNNGNYKDGKVESFIEDAYNVTSSSNFTYKYYYWGQWGNSTIGTHQGHDMYSSSANSAIYSLHGGTVKLSSTYGAVLIYNSSANKTYIYAHMKDIAVTANSTVSAGQLLGYESNVGASGRHLHFEVRSGNVSSLASPSGLNSVSPYEHMS